MSSFVISVITIVVFIGFLAMGQHIGLALMVGGFVGMWILRDFDIAVAELATISWGAVGKFSFAVIPLFMLMGSFATHGGITSELFDACYKWFGRLRGGLAYVAIATSSLFHCFCGSATATAATIGMVCYPEMVKYKYKSLTSCGVIASSAAFGLLIPPSIGFILYGTIADGVSIGRMFAAGIIPALITIGGACIVVYVIALRNPDTMPRGEEFTLNEKLKSLKGVAGFGFLFILVLGGIFGGFFSPSEGGAIGAFGGLLILILRRKANLKTIVASLKESIHTAVMIYLVVIGAQFFGNTLAMTQMPNKLAQAVMASNVSPGIILWIIVIIYIIFGTAIDTLPIITVLTPIFWPLVIAMNWNPYWFGIVTVTCMLIGLITPPTGVPCFVMAGMTGEPLLKVFGACFPYLIMLLISLVLFMYVPILSTWLPSLIK